MPSPRALRSSLACLALVPIAIVAGFNTAAAAPDPCGAGLATARGTHVAADLKCHAKAAKRGSVVDPTCVADADAALAKTFGKLAAKGCAPGNATDVAAANGVFVATAVARLRLGSGDDACAAAKLAAVGVKVRGKLRCHAHALTKGAALDPACLTPVETAFGRSFLRAERKGSCLVIDDAAVLEADVDAFIEQVFGGPPCVDLIEHDLPDGWSVDPDEFTTTLSVLGPADALIGDAALRADTDSGFLWTLRWTPSTPVDVSAATTLAFSVRILDPSPVGWQGNFPAVALRDGLGRLRRYEPTSNLLPVDGVAWRTIQVPLGGDSGWTLSGDAAFDATSVESVGFEADTWDYGFRFDIDGLMLAGPTCAAPCACGVHGTCGSGACQCDLGWSGSKCDQCAAGWVAAANDTCVLPSDGAATTWPNRFAPANSSPWLAAHHTDVRRLRPTVLVMNFANPSNPGAVRALVDTIIAGFAEGSRESGDEHPTAKPQLQYRVFGDAVIDMRDGVGGRPPAPPDWPYDNSTLLPRRAPGEPGGWSMRYADLFSEAFASNYGVPDPAVPGRFLTLCELAERGTIHDVWLVASQDVPDVSLAEVLEAKPRYDDNGNRLGTAFNRCAGNGCFDDDVPQCAVSLRIGFVNYTRGPGCYLHSYSHGIESTAVSATTPGLSKWFLNFAGFDFGERWGLPFSSFYGLGCPAPPCIAHPTPGSLAVQTFGDPIARDPFDPVCGNVHFSPNAVDHYDYGNPNPVLSSCRAFGSGGALGLVGANDWSQYPYPIYGDCGGEFLVWWMQRMPGVSGTRRFADGSAMRAIWPYLFY